MVKREKNIKQHILIKMCCINLLNPNLFLEEKKKNQVLRLQISKLDVS